MLSLGLVSGFPLDLLWVLIVSRRVREPTPPPIGKFLPLPVAFVSSTIPRFGATDY